MQTTRTSTETAATAAAAAAAAPAAAALQEVTTTRLGPHTPDAALNESLQVWRWRKKPMLTHFGSRLAHGVADVHLGLLLLLLQGHFRVAQLLLRRVQFSLQSLIKAIEKES